MILLLHVFLMLFFRGWGVGMLDNNEWMSIRQNKTSVSSIFIASVVSLNTGNSNDYGLSFCVHVYRSENYLNVFVTRESEAPWSLAIFRILNG